jgi:hypothetical protein
LEVSFVAEDTVFYKLMTRTVKFIRDCNVENDLLFD